MLRSSRIFKSLRNRAVGVLLLSAFAATSSCYPEFTSKTVINPDGTGTYEAEYRWTESQFELTHAMFDGVRSNSVGPSEAIRAAAFDPFNIENGLRAEGYDNITVQVAQQNVTTVINQRASILRTGPVNEPDQVKTQVVPKYSGPFVFLKTSNPDIIKVAPVLNMLQLAVKLKAPLVDSCNPKSLEGLDDDFLAMLTTADQTWSRVAIWAAIASDVRSMRFHVTLPGEVVEVFGVERDPKNPNAVVWSLDLAGESFDEVVLKLDRLTRLYATIRKPAHFSIPLIDEGDTRSPLKQLPNGIAGLALHGLESLTPIARVIPPPESSRVEQRFEIGSDGSGMFHHRSDTPRLGSFETPPPELRSTTQRTCVNVLSNRVGHEAATCSTREESLHEGTILRRTIEGPFHRWGSPDPEDSTRVIGLAFFETESPDIVLATDAMHWSPAQTPDLARWERFSRAIDKNRHILPSILPSEVHVESTKLTFPGVVVDCTGGSRVPSDPHSIIIENTHDSLSAESFVAHANALFNEANRIEVPHRPRFEVRFRKPKDFSIPLHPMKAVADSRPKNEVK